MSQVWVGLQPAHQQEGADLILIVEGPDGAGKSTLVQHLSEKFGLDVGERGISNRDRLYEVTRQDTYNALAMAIRGHIAPLIWDRLGPISDPIYSKVQGREPAFHPDEIRLFHRAIEALQSPIIFCMPALEVVQANVEDSEQMEGVKENVTNIWMQYQTMAQTFREAHPSLTYFYDYTGSMTGWPYWSLDALENKVGQFLTARKVREWGQEDEEA